jgi:hypothetical protein
MFARRQTSSRRDAKVPSPPGLACSPDRSPRSLSYVPELLTTCVEDTQETERQDQTKLLNVQPILLLVLSIMAKAP